MAQTPTPQGQGPTTAFWCDPGVGDLIIRSSDGVDFHVHRDVLSRASPFFATMFSLPQGSDSSANVPGGKPFVETHENKDVWTALIPLCYAFGMSTLHVTSLSLIGSLLDAARKYQMDPVTDCLRSTLLQPLHIEKQPLSVYALGSAFGLADVALLAAQHSLRTPIFFDYVDELDLISVRTYHRLVEYRKQCCAAALRVVSWTGPNGWLALTPTNFRHLEVSCSVTAPKACKRVARTGIWVRQSWATYIDKLERMLEYTPVADQACLPALLNPVIKSAKDCPQCSKTIEDSVAQFTGALQRELKGAIAKVQLN